MTYLADYELVEWLGTGNHGEWWLAIAPDRLGLRGPERPPEGVEPGLRGPERPPEGVEPGLRGPERPPEGVEPGLRGPERPPEGVLVAMKALWRDASELDFDRMARELRLLVSISSPYLVHLVEAGESDGRLFYVRDHYADGSLAGPNVPRARVLMATAAAARAAHALHENGVVHRDIKPDNILLTDAGAAVPAVLSELGLAQLLDPGLTTGIGPVGAIDYVAPEVALGDSGSPASDVWALGVTLHQALTGQSVYGGETPDNILDGFRRVTSGRWSLDPSLADADRLIVERCLQRQPEDRISSALALADELETLVKDSTGGAPA